MEKNFFVRKQFTESTSRCELDSLAINMTLMGALKSVLCCIVFLSQIFYSSLRFTYEPQHKRLITYVKLSQVSRTPWRTLPLT